MKRIGVIGGGAWGTALAAAACERGLKTLLWAREPEVVESINTGCENPLFLPEIKLPATLQATGDLAEAAACDLVLFVPPTQHLRVVATEAAPHIKPEAIVIVACKGIEIDTLQLPTSILAETLTHSDADKFVVLSGPSFAKEVARSLPVDLVAASGNLPTAEHVQQLLHAPNFRVYTSKDTVGVQIGGALKNVVAVACGGSDGFGLGHNARAALITRGLAELTRAGVALGADPLTFLGLAGVGDLVLTCTGDLSRNRTFGRQLAEGKTPEQIFAASRSVVEGFYTAQAAVSLADKHDIDMPIARTVHAVCCRGVPVAEAAIQLLARERKSELTGIAD